MTARAVDTRLGTVRLVEAINGSAKQGYTSISTAICLNPGNTMRKHGTKLVA